MPVSSVFSAFSASMASECFADGRWSVHRRVGFSFLFAASTWALVILITLEIGRIVAHTNL